MEPTTEQTEHTDPAKDGGAVAGRSGRRTVAQRIGGVLGPLILFVFLPVALRALIERIPWSGFDEIGDLGLALGFSVAVGLLVAGRLRGWYVPGVKELLVALAIAVLSYVLAFQAELRLGRRDLSHILQNVRNNALRVLLYHLRLLYDLAAAGRGVILKSDIHSISPLLASAL